MERNKREADSSYSDGRPNTGGVFTRFIGALKSNGEAPDDVSFQQVWQALRGALVAEIRRRGMWWQPPHFLGIHGWNRWTEGPRGDVGRSMDALEELTADAYSFIFIDRLAALQAQLRTKPNIEGLVFLNVRHLLHELQRRHDPLGARVFTLLKTALEGLVEGQSMWSEPAVKGGAAGGVFTFAGTAGVTEPTQEELGLLIQPWSDVLLPDLVTTLGSGYQKLVERLQERILALESEGIQVISLSSLATVLKADVRRRWAAILDVAGGEKGVEGFDENLSQLVPLVPPDNGFETRQSFRELENCVRRRLLREFPDDTKRSELLTVWLSLVSWAAERLPEGLCLNLDLSSARSPSQRQMARALGIPRRRLSVLYGILGGLARTCRESSRRTLDTERRASAESVGERMEPRSDLKERLRLATGRAAARAERDDKDLAQGPQEPQPGDLYVLTSEGPSIEWLVLEASSSQDAPVKIIPADLNPLLGSADLAVPEEVPGGPLSLRTACAMTVEVSRFLPEKRSRRLPEDVWKTAKAQHRLWNPDKDPSLGSPEDLEPAYRAWMEEVRSLARSLQRSASPSFGEISASISSRRPTLPTRPRWLEVLAAASILIALGLTARVVQQERRLALQNLPYLEPLVLELELSPDPKRGPVSLEVSQEVEHVLLDVLFSPPTCDLLKIEVLNSDSKVLWTSPTFRTPLHHEVRLGLPQPFLLGKPALLRLHGFCGDQWRIEEERGFNIVSP